MTSFSNAHTDWMRQRCRRCRRPGPGSKPSSVSRVLDACRHRRRRRHRSACGRAATFCDRCAGGDRDDVAAGGRRHRGRRPTRPSSWPSVSDASESPPPLKTPAPMTATSSAPAAPTGSHFAMSSCSRRAVRAAPAAGATAAGAADDHRWRWVGSGGRDGRSRRHTSGRLVRSTLPIVNSRWPAATPGFQRLFVTFGAGVRAGRTSGLSEPSRCRRDPCGASASRGRS